MTNNILGGKNMDYYNDIKTKLIDNEIYGRVKDYSKERNRLNTYYEVGKLLSEAGKHYGEDIIGDYSRRLTKELGKKYNKKLLFRIRQLYILLSNQKVATLSRQLSLSHIFELIPLSNVDEINYYCFVANKYNLSVRQLRERIKLREYHRLSDETKTKLINNVNLELIDNIPEPIIIKSDRKVIGEKVLQKVILEDVSSFLESLGNGFTFIKNEYKIKIGNSFNYIDLLLFNYEYNCFVVVELKVTEIRKEHIGQIEVYMNYIDSCVKKINHDKTIGIILVRKNNKFVIEYVSDKRIVSRKYKIINI